MEAETKGPTGAEQAQACALAAVADGPAAHRHLRHDRLPSGAYPLIDPPVARLIQHATSPSRNKAPRAPASQLCAARDSGHKAPRATDAPPLGAGRGGLPGELSCEAAHTLYVGQVLAGQPHGWGCMYLTDTLPTPGQAASTTCSSSGPGSEHFLQYEGQWERGRRQGEGRLWDASGCCYTGTFHQGEQHMEGRMVFCCGDAYTGQWRRGRRHGRGCLAAADGSAVFVGCFEEGSKQGPGTLYKVRQGQKYQAEYHDGTAVCGVWSSLGAADLELLAQVAREQAQAAGGAAATPAFPAAAAAVDGGGKQQQQHGVAVVPAPVPPLLPKPLLAAPFEVLASSVQHQRPWLAAASPPASPTGAPGLPLPPPPPLPPGAAPGAACLAGAELEALQLAARREVAGVGRRREHDALITHGMWGRIMVTLQAVLPGGGMSPALGMLLEQTAAAVEQEGGVRLGRLLEAACTQVAPM